MMDERGEIGERDPNYVPDPLLEEYKWPSQKSIDWLNKNFPAIDMMPPKRPYVKKGTVQRPGWSINNQPPIVRSAEVVEVLGEEPLEEA